MEECSMFAAFEVFSRINSHAYSKKYQSKKGQKLETVLFLGQSNNKPEQCPN